jgi:thiol-disulfide isomerase/thioredoxin
MDRLSALIVVLALVASCDKKVEEAPEGRTNGAKVAAKRTDAAAFCDKIYKAESAPVFKPPPLASGALATPAKWRWINVWATWCKPCTDEIPRIVAWQPKLGFELQLVSVDDNDADVEELRKEHPDMPASSRIAKPEAQGPWLKELGLDEGAPIPVHVLVDASNHIRCVRAGGVREQDLPMIESLLGSR